jgi:hypothetical protein
MSFMSSVLPSGARARVRCAGGGCGSSSYGVGLNRSTSRCVCRYQLNILFCPLS